MQHHSIETACTQRTPQVLEKLKRLNDSSEGLSHCAHQLRERLIGVLTPEPEAPPSNSRPAELRQPDLCNVASQIDTIDAVVISVTNLLQNVIRRLEV